MTTKTKEKKKTTTKKITIPTLSIRITITDIIVVSPLSPSFLLLMSRPRRRRYKANSFLAMQQ